MMRAFHVRSVQANLMYHDLPGTGTPVVVLHGLGCASSCDYPCVAADPALASRRMLLIDLLGSGFSERPSGFGYTVDDHARTVAELLAGLRLDRVSVFGHSMGGAVAIALAARLGPKVEKLALSEPNLDPGGGFFSRKIAAMSETDYVAYGHAEMAAAAAAEGNAIWAASLSISAAFAVHRGAVSLSAGCEPTWRELLCRLHAPRTVIFGERSLPDADLDWLPRHGCTVDVVPAAGHSMAWDNPRGLAIALSKAL